MLRLFGVFGKYEAWDVRFISNACARVVQGLPIVIRQNVSLRLSLCFRSLPSYWHGFSNMSRRQKAYNVCRGEAFTLRELAEMVAAASGRNPEIIVHNPALAPSTARITRVC